MLEHGIVSLLNAPILIDRASWGVLKVDHVEQRDFCEETVDFLPAVSCLIASVIQRHQAAAAHGQALAAAALEKQQRDLLLAEMQHRMKNKFQMILPMISIERPKLPTSEGRAIMTSVAERIMAVSLGNDQLSTATAEQRIGMPSYLRAICSRLAGQREDVTIAVKADEISLPSERAVPIGLIANGLVTNSLKYAFRGRARGIVTVELLAGAGSGRAISSGYRRRRWCGRGR